MGVNKKYQSAGSFNCACAKTVERGTLDLSVSTHYTDIMYNIRASLQPFHCAMHDSHTLTTVVKENDCSFYYFAKIETALLFLCKHI